MVLMLLAGIFGVVLFLVPNPSRGVRLFKFAYAVALLAWVLNEYL